MKGFSIFGLLVSIAFGFSAGAYNHGGNGGGSSANNPSPTPINSNGAANCMDHGNVLTDMNDQALQWKAHQASGFQARALVSGVVDEVFPDHSGHRHFSIKIGPQADDHIEVIYNVNFGAMPLPQAGEAVSACGDYIVATEQNGGYPPSPDGALIHWVHKSPHAGHDSGFVILNGVLYGNGTGN